MLDFIGDLKIDENIKKEIFRDFNKKLNMDKIQIIAFENICENNFINVINGEKNNYKYYFNYEYTEITHPFLNSYGWGYINPFNEYKGKFEKSNFMELIKIIKNNINENSSENEVKKFIENF